MSFLFSFFFFFHFPFAAPWVHSGPFSWLCCRGIPMYPAGWGFRDVSRLISLLHLHNLPRPLCKLPLSQEAGEKRVIMVGSFFTNTCTEVEAAQAMLTDATVMLRDSLLFHSRHGGSLQSFDAFQYCTTSRRYPMRWFYSGCPSLRTFIAFQHIIQSCVETHHEATAEAGYVHRRHDRNLSWTKTWAGWVDLQVQMYSETIGKLPCLAECCCSDGKLKWSPVWSLHCQSVFNGWQARIEGMDNQTNEKNRTENIFCVANPSLPFSPPKKLKLWTNG